MGPPVGADLFALGAILYEMLTGQRAFQRETGPETLTAILKEIRRICRLREAMCRLRSTASSVTVWNATPADRFQSARDLAFNLQTASSTVGSIPVSTSTTGNLTLIGGTLT